MSELGFDLSEEEGAAAFEDDLAQMELVGGETFEPPEVAEPRALVLVAEAEAELAAEGEGGPSDMRARLDGVRRVSIAKRRAAEESIEEEVGELDQEDEEIDRTFRGRREAGADALQGSRRKKAAAVRGGRGRKKVRFTASREDLKTRLLTAQTEQKADADQRLLDGKVALETALQDQFFQLIEAQKLQDEKMVAELAVANTELAAQIEKKRIVHLTEIGRQQIALDLTAENEKAAARAEALVQSGEVEETADLQAEHTRQESNIQAGNVDAAATRDAATARRTGESKATQATDAAEDRATLVEDDGEKAAIRSDGEGRAADARAQAEARAVEIEDTGIGESTRVREKGVADATAQEKRGDDDAVAAVARGEAGVVKITGERDEAVAELALTSQLAVAEMERERAAGMVELEMKRALALTKMANAQALAVVKIDGERTKAIKALHVEHTALVTAIDAELAADLVKLETASVAELARLEREIDRDIAALEAQAKRAERRMQAAVNRAEAAAKTEVTRRRSEIRRAGRQVLRAIDGVVDRARARIDAADKDTGQEIADSALQGVKDIAAEGQTVRGDNRADSDAAISDQVLEAQADRSESADISNQAIDDMKSDRESLAGEIDQAWVDDAVARSGDRLTRDGVDAITDEESVEAMNILASLPPDLQGQALEGLSDDQFGELLTEVPEARHEQFESLVANTTDPRRKLELWGAFHKSRATQDAIRDGSGWIEEIAEDTDDEVDEELEFLRAKDEAGTLTEDDVKMVALRKNLEHGIEMDYRINLTNEDDLRADGSQVVWTAAELAEMRTTFDQMPASHVAGNSDLEEIRREDIKDPLLGAPNPKTGGDHDDGTIRVFDTGVKGNYRHTGHAHEGGNPLAPGGPIGRLEEVLVHEVGHDIHDQNEEIWNRFGEAAGWEKDMDEDLLGERGLTEAQIEDMEENQTSYTVDGRVYTYRYGEFLSFDEDRVPATGQPSARGRARDTWEYARTNYKDHFAETYMKGVLVPEQLARDLIDDPATRVVKETSTRDIATGARDTAKANLAALQATSPAPSSQDILAAMGQVVDAETDLTRAQETLDDATADQGGLAEQYRIMREEIFHTGEAAAEARSRLVAKGVSGARLDDFDQKAARLSTPEQIAALEAQY